MSKNKHNSLDAQDFIVLGSMLNWKQILERSDWRARVVCATED